MPRPQRTNIILLIAATTLFFSACGDDEHNDSADQSPLPVEDTHDAVGDCSGEQCTNTAICGNNIIEPGETCEGSFMPEGLSCTDLDPRFAHGTSRCVDCQFSLDNCTLAGVCGNMIRDQGESCDDGNDVDGDGCSSNCQIEASIGFDDGGLGCDNTGRDMFGNAAGEADVFCDAPDNRDTYQPTQPIELQVKVHIVRQQGQQLAASQARVEALMQETSAYFADAAVRFRWGGWVDVDIIDDNNGVFFNLTKSQFNNLVAINNDLGAVDIYIVNTFSNLNGRATDIGPLGPDRDSVVLRQGANGTLSHELGHIFGLWHPHHDTANQQDGGDCNLSFDLCCDTPYDPGPSHAAPEGSGLCNNPASPTCAAASCSDGSTPDIHNVMSYYQCGDDPWQGGSFTNQQIARMRCYIERNYSYAIVKSCDENPATGNIISPSSGFTANGPFTVTGRVSDLDGIETITIAIDNLDACKFQASAANLSSNDFEIIVQPDHVNCQLTSGPHVAGLWLRDACGTAALLDSFEFTFNSNARICGDGSLDNGEQCDGSNLGGASCASLGYSGGTLSCTTACAFNTSGCTSANQAPTAPNVNAPSSTTTGTATSVSITLGTDPDGTQTRVSCSSSGSNYPSASPYNSGLRAEGSSVTASFSWNTTGTKTISCTTLDSQGSASAAATNTISVNASSTPASGTLSSPGSGVTHVGAFTISGSAADSAGLDRVTVALNWPGGNYNHVLCDGAACGASSYSFNQTINPASFNIPNNVPLTLAVWTRDDQNNTEGPFSARTITWFRDYNVSANYTSSFSTPPSPCPGSASQLYQGRASSITGNVASMVFQKCDATTIAAGRDYWIVTGSAIYPNAADLNVYVERKVGTFTSAASSQTISSINIWPSTTALQEANCGETKNLFIITDGSDRVDQKAWYQYRVVTFTKNCL
jgi:cysteine-rich repeat protein